LDDAKAEAKDIEQKIDSSDSLLPNSTPSEKFESAQEQAAGALSDMKDATTQTASNIKDIIKEKWDNTVNKSETEKINLSA